MRVQSVQNYCFSLSNMQICEVFVAVVVVYLKLPNILATFSLLSVYTSKFLTWQFFLVKEKLARQIFLDKENLATIPHLYEQFFLVKANLRRRRQQKPHKFAYICIGNHMISSAIWNK